VAFKFELDSAGRRVRVWMGDPGGASEAVAVVAAVGAVLKAAAPHAVLIDERRLGHVLTQSEAQRVGAEFERWRSAFRGPVALVAGSVLQFGVARMVAALAEVAGVNAGGFLEIDEAERWLARELAKLDAMNSARVLPLVRTM
jgi:hypothetical protein